MHASGFGTLHSFTGRDAGSVTVELSVKVRVADVVVTGLTPGANYTLSVTAENAVSSQDTTGRNVISISARTDEGGIVSHGFLLEGVHVIFTDSYAVLVEREWIG